jgi:hypothetical protein
MILDGNLRKKEKEVNSERQSRKAMILDGDRFRLQSFKIHQLKIQLHKIQ